jgi:hypothetical protein
MRRHAAPRISRLGAIVLAWGLFAVGPAVAEPPQWTLDGLAQMSWPELEALYRAAEPAAIAPGYACGRAIYCPGAPVSGVRTKVTGWMWKGKVFCEDATLVNQWLGFRAIRARVYLGESYLDGCLALIMDYSTTSHVWADVRDEVREVAPGLFLGVMYRGSPCAPQRKMFFALQVCSEASGGR